MAIAQPGGRDFLSNLGQIYRLYTFSFLGCVVLLAVLEQIGMPKAWIGYAFVALTIGVYAAIGILSRTAEVSEYYVAGRKVPAMYNGMATAADWMSAASFIGMAGSLYLLGYNGLAFILGWTGGFVLVATLIAPFLRKFGAYTIPDFFSFRYGGKVARTLAIIVLMSCSFTYVVAQIVGTGLIGARLLNMDYVVAVYVGLVGILVCSMLGGMRAVTWTQVAQYIVLIIAYLIPVVILSAQKYGIRSRSSPMATCSRRSPPRKPRSGRRRRGRPGGWLHQPVLRQPGPLGRGAVGRVRQLFRPDPLPHGRHGVPAARPHALLHHPLGA